MTQILLLILGIIIVAVLLTQSGRERVKGICAAVVGVDAKKRENKERILKLFEMAPSTSLGNKSISNADIRSALGISERSVVRYMDELEREGKVEQVGPTGRSVSYRLKSQKIQQ